MLVSQQNVQNHTTDIVFGNNLEQLALNIVLVLKSNFELFFFSNKMICTLFDSCGDYMEEDHCENAPCDTSNTGKCVWQVCLK